MDKMNEYAELCKKQNLIEEVRIDGTLIGYFKVRRHVHRDELSEYVQNYDSRDEVMSTEDMEGMEADRYYIIHYKSEAHYEMAKLTNIGKMALIKKLESKVERLQNKLKEILGILREELSKI